MTERDSSSGATPEEIEIKLPCSDLDAVREALRSHGGEPRTPRHAESNDLYDDPSSSLRGRGCILRLRRDSGGTLLTFKGPARFEGGLRMREEREVRVSDAQEAEAILRGLGLKRLFRYEKRREEWRLGECVVALDETPIGRFVEIEGSPAAIRRVVTAIGLDFGEAIPYSYARLYRMRREQDRSLPPDMLFPQGE